MVPHDSRKSDLPLVVFEITLIFGYLNNIWPFSIFLQIFAVPNANFRRLRRYGLFFGLFPPRIDLEKQTSLTMAMGRLQTTGPTVQKELENTVSSPSYKLYSGCLELFQANN